MTARAIQLFTSSAILTWFLVLLIIPVLHYYFIDSPNHRSSHSIPTPRGGGIAFVLVGTFMNLIFTSGSNRWIPIICLPLAIVGLIDDLKSLSASLRYTFQIGTAVALIFSSNINPPIWGWIILTVLVTALINFVNFMDGLDGLVAGCGVILLASTSSWAIAGAIFGFLIWNWSPAKVFMGDVGSTYIGSVFIGLALHSHSYSELIILILIGFPLFADTSVCVVRRLVNSENIFKAHRKHLFQRLYIAGWSHEYVSSLYIGAVALLFISYRIGGIVYLIFFMVCELFLGIFLEANIAKEFAHD